MLLIKNAKIYTAAGKVIEKGDILVEKGKIKKIGSNLEAEGAKTIDADGLVAIPGIIDAHSHISGFGQGMSDQDLNEVSGNATPQVEAVFSVDTGSEAFERALKAGITTSAIAPGSGNVIGGTVCAVKSHGKNIEEMCIKNPIALKAALGGNPKGVYGKRNQLPMTRMGIAQVIRENMIKAQEYMDKQEKAGDDQSKMPPRDLGMENVAKVLRKEISLKIHCTQFDIITAIRLSREFDIDFTLEHAWGASDYYDDIMESGCKGIVYGPIGVPLGPGERRKLDIFSLVELDRRGMPCAIMTDGPIFNPDMIVVQAGEVVRAGGRIERVINMLTINAARIMGVDDRIGSLEPGKDADIALFRGTPALDTNARVEHTIVNGEVVWSRQ